MKKIILLVSLFSVVAIGASEFRLFNKYDPAYTPSIGFLDAELLKNKVLYDENKKLERQAEEKLLQTHEGQAYAKVSSDWHNCLDANGFESSQSKAFRSIREGALVKLMQRPEYQEYLFAITKSEHYHTKMTGLVRMRDFAVFQSKRYGSEREAMTAGLESMKLYNQNPSTTTLKWINDSNKTQLEVKQELSDILKKVSQLERDIK